MTISEAAANPLVLRAVDGTEYAVQPSTLIGRDADCQIVITEGGISRHHARLSSVTANGVMVEDMQSTNGTFINGERLTAARELAIGDELRLHKTCLSLQPARRQIAAADATYMLRPGELARLQELQEVRIDVATGRGPCLIALTAPNRGKVFLLQQTGPLGEWLIGRDGAAAVRLVDRSVSKQHARISRQGSRWRIEHLGNTNELFINGEAVAAHDLRAGDNIRLGRSELQFQIDYQGELPPAAAGQRGMLGPLLFGVLMLAALAAVVATIAFAR